MELLLTVWTDLELDIRDPDRLSMSMARDTILALHADLNALGIANATVNRTVTAAQMQIPDDSESITKILVITIAVHTYLTMTKTSPLHELQLQLQHCLMTTGIGTTPGTILETEVEIKIEIEMATLINDLESAVSLLTDLREEQEIVPMDYDERMTDRGDLQTEAAREVTHRRQ